MFLVVTSSRPSIYLTYHAPSKIMLLPLFSLFQLSSILSQISHFFSTFNLKVPELATYLLISVFPQTPLILYLAYVQPVKFPIDYILGSFMLVFLVRVSSTKKLCMLLAIRLHFPNFISNFDCLFNPNSWLNLALDYEQFNLK